MSLPASSQLKNIMEKENSHRYSGGEKLSPAANLLCPVLSLVSSPDQSSWLSSAYQEVDADPGFHCKYSDFFFLLYNIISALWSPCSS